MRDLQTTIIKKLTALSFRNWHRGTIAAQRARQERMSRFEMPNPGVSFEPAQIDVLEAAWIRPVKPAKTILYLHGGAYTLGSINTHRSLAGMLSKATDCQILLIQYRLAPENPFPAGLEDSIHAYKWLLDQEIPPEEIILAGDSAGGGLALAALLSLRDAGMPLPAGAVLLSPWTDLTLSGESITTQASADFILNAPHLAEMARLYAGDQALNHPLISPLFADLSGLPSLLIQTGTDEILLDDSRRLAQLAEKAGVAVQLEIYEDMFHVFQMFPFFKDTREAFDSIAKFIDLASDL